MKAHVHVRLKPGILDPQGKAVQQALHHLGFRAVESVRIGKLIELEVAAETREEAEALVQQACQKLLANPVIETYDIEWVDAS
ncbi:MAG: phosphoribosylformylglycinamidine synthase subunit PurS [Calditrichaeota bacterium]|nr:MAG: phosphoribosylformylglycinamidine synthase subunit PurS [Calditrichota bacterium]